jgi:hypothetical protein
MTRGKTYRGTIEGTVKMPDVGLSRKELNALKKVFKNELVATFGDVLARTLKRKSPAKRIVVRQHKSMTR